MEYQTSMSYEEAIAIVKLWIQIGGRKEIELGALEPTLWTDGNKKIDSLVLAFSQMGCEVNMTTNGSTLKKFSHSLYNAGINLLRVSWHSTNPKLFKEISGGHGNYNDFYDGILTACELGIPISFNKLLLKGTIEGFEEQLDFIEKYNCKLKLYDLLWTNEIKNIYSENYINWRQPIKDFVLHRTKKITRKYDSIGRNRICFVLFKGGLIEVKMGDVLKRDKTPCDKCTYKDVCLEDYFDYARIDSGFNFYSCYMRRDLGFNIGKSIKINDFNGFKNGIKSMMNENTEKFLSSTPLRFTIMPACNFNCRLPGTSLSWCMEMNEAYRYPKIKKSIFD